MRFHFGCSFRPKTLIKYIGLGLLGLLAFLGLSKANASTLGYSSIQVNNSNNQSVMFCNANTSKTCPANFPLGGYQELIGRTFLINFDNTTLTNNHNYTFAIEFLIAHDSSDTAFEQESFLIYQTGSNGALNDTTITWSYSTTYDWEQDYYITSYTYQGQFKATSTSPFYASLRMENNESFFGVAVGNISLTDDSMNEEIINANYQNTQNIINNQNSNTNNIINNQDSNTQSIIDNQNANTQSINNNLESCRDSVNLLNYSMTNQTKCGVTFTQNDDKTITASGTSTCLIQFNLYGSNNTPGSVFLPYGNYYFSGGVSSNKKITLRLSKIVGNSTFLDNSGTYQPFTIDSSVTGLWLYINIPSGITLNDTFKPMISKNAYVGYEPFGQQVCKPKLDNLNDSIQDLNDTISDDSIDTSSSNDFFDNFSNNTHGLTGIVSLPLTTIQGLNNANCTPITLTIPYLQSNNTLQLPCLTPIYQSNFGSFFTLYQTIIFGFISYYVCVKVFNMVKDFKDPNKDKIEVMDL